LADVSVDRAHSPAATNAATTRIHKTAETSPTTSPTTSLIATTATFVAARDEGEEQVGGLAFER
jgi:hypothetical protein